MNNKTTPETPDAQALTQELVQEPVQALIQSLAKQHIRLKLSDTGELAVRGEKANLTPALIAQIKQHKAALISWLQAQQAGAGDDLQATLASAEPVPVQQQRDGLLPLSHAQQRLWLLDRMLSSDSASAPNSTLKGTPQYNMSAAFTLRGNLNQNALQQALDHIMSRHEILRTRYVEAQDAAGEGRQVIDATGSVPVRKHTLNELAIETVGEDSTTKITDFLQQCAHQPFNLAEQHPVRCDLLTVQADHHILLFTMHHIASDEWSLNVVTQEFATLYQAICASGSNQDQEQEQNQEQSWQHSLPALDCQYLDYTLWQQASLKAANESASVKSPMQFWQETLANAPALHSLPTDFRRPATQDGKGDIVQSELSPELSQNLRELARRCGVTPFVLLHSTFALLIAKWSDSPANSESQTNNESQTKISDIVIGTPVAGRDHKSLQALIGFFVNTLALRTRVDEQLSFQDFLAQNKTDIMAAFSHQQVPFDALVEALSVDVSQRYSPLVQIMFTALDGNRETLNLAGLDIADFPLPLQTSKFDISVALIDDASGNFGLVWNYATALFSRRTIENMQQSWEVLLRQIVAAPQGKLCDLSLLALKKDALVQDWAVKNKEETETQRYNGSIDQLVYEQASRVPDQVAVVDCAPRTPDEKQLTYRELIQRADKLAAQLLNAQTAASTPVALLVERSIDMVVAMLGIVRAGMCYVPLAADNPPSRSAAILADCGAQIMVSHRGLAAGLKQQLIQELIQEQLTQEQAQTDSAFPQQIVNLDELFTQDESSNSSPTPEPTHENDRLAYIIYTSGSTGKPKGVMIKQHSIVNLVYRNAFFTPSDNEVLGQCANHAFDAATFEVWGALANGKCTAIVSKQQLLDTRAFARVIRDYRISTLFLTTAYLNQISHDLAANDLQEKVQDEQQTGVDLSQLNNLYFGGEAADINAVNRVFDHMSGRSSKEVGARRLVHVYGPTETTTFSSWHLITAPCVDNCPIGKPLTAHQHLVLDDNQQPVPDGVVGELYIGGLGVSAGYLNNPTLTANAFTGFLETEHRTLDNSLYRTGDKVKRDHQGNLVFMHRADSQVKLRGFRIELEEIVAHLSRIDGVDDAYVQIEQGQIEQEQIETDQTKQEQQAQQKLVAYLAGEQAVASPEALIQTCQRTLAAQLPEYMLPSEYGCCRAFVLTANGKIDQQALPDYYAMPVSEGRVAPRNEVEQKLTDMWQELLEIDAQQFGVTDNFFELGAHSLTAVKLEFSVRETYGNALSVEDIFNYPSIEELAKIITDADQSSNVLESIPVADRSQPLPLSYGQRRLWFVDQIQGQSPEYNMPNALRFKGELNVDAMQAALNALLQRHESLRTCFTLIDEQPVCHIQQVSELPLQRHDLSELAAENPAQAEQKAAQLLTELAREPFDLAKDIMLKVALIVLAPQDHILLFNQHHIASDGWSVDVMTRELMSLYQQESQEKNNQQQANQTSSPDPLPELPVQYADFALWQHQQLQSNSLTSRITEQLNYWREQLADAPAVHHLPLDFMRPREQSFVGNNHLMALSPEQSQGLRELANQLDVTLFTLLQSVFALLVAKWSGENDVLIGTPVAGRDHPELESVIGFFVNNLVLRSQINPNTPLREYIAASKTMVMDAFSHQHVPFDMLVEELNPERSLSHSPLYQIGFLLNPADRQLFSLPSLEIEGMEIGESTCKFDLNLIAIEDKSHISLLWEYAASLFTPSTIANMAHSFALLVKQIVANPSQTLGELALTDHAALKQFCTWHGKPYVAPAQPLLHQQFSEQARRTPEAIVASVADSELSASYLQEQHAQAIQYQELQYQELEALSNRVAQQLRQHIHQPDTCVILLVERDVNMLIGMLGILKAGGAYVPLDTDMPASRMRDIVEDCGATLVLCDDINKARQGVNGGSGNNNSLHFIDINQAQTAAVSKGQEVPEPIPGQTDHSLAYVIYTSGSTGKPKGVMVSHRNVMRLVKNNAFVPFGASDVVAQVSNHSFDAATFEVWGALVNGSRLQFIDKPTLLDPIALSNALVAHGISIMFITASLFNQLVFADQHGYEGLRYLLVGGEAIDVNSVNQMLAQHRPAHLLNAYGPTENTTFSLTHDIQTQRSDYYPIGKSIGGNTHYVLDANLNLLPPGVVGELYLGGDGVARGYLNNPELTAKAFIANPFADEKVKHITGDASPYLYKTGDRVFYNADGEVIYIGRADHQVKLRGYRIELTEIQQVLREYHAIDDAFVTVCGEGLQRHIVAYVTLPEQSSSDSDPQLDQQACYNYLRSRLPDYMVPQTLMPLAAFPLNANGKFDRKALPEPAFAALATDSTTGSATHSATKTPPQTPTEQQLHGLWCALFAVAEKGENVGIEDNFFALGGHSIMATRLVADINRTFGTALNIRIIFENQTISAQARLIDTTLAEQPDQQGVKIEQRFASDAAVEEMEL